MRTFLMTIFLAMPASFAQADTQFTPWIFDLHTQFDDCIATEPSLVYHTCQSVLAAQYTLRREIGYALDECSHLGSTECDLVFTKAGFPADKLYLSSLGRCTMLGKLEETNITEILENSCIDVIARQITRGGIATQHNTEISSGINYIESAGIIDKGTEYWKTAMEQRHYEQIQTIPDAEEFRNSPETGYQLYSLLDRRFHLQIALAEVECKLQTVHPHWANPMDYTSCMGEAYAKMWQTGWPDLSP